VLAVQEALAVLLRERCFRRLGYESVSASARRRPDTSSSIGSPCDIRTRALSLGWGAPAGAVARAASGGIL